MVRNLSDKSLGDLLTASWNLESDSYSSSSKVFDDKKIKDLEYREDINATIEKRFPELFINKDDANKKRFISNNDVTVQKENVDGFFSHSHSTKLTNDKPTKFIKEKVAIYLSAQMQVTNDTHQRKSSDNVVPNNSKSSKVISGFNLNQDDFPKKQSEIIINIPAGEVLPNSIPKIFSSAAEVPNKNSDEKQLLLTQKMKSFHAQTISFDRLDTKEVKLNYPFQSWSGVHSVKVSLPMVTNRQGSIILQPSDTFTSDAISRQLDRLVDLQPELLRPHKEREQRQGRHHHDIEQQDDES